ncbi:HAD family hydrolase [Yoonia sp. 2307UL14-13]|uniref:HAD family hydrolase n=1 Tax=Yoonia sp. 2307UL14-13 TaxID=3126506 RepID=UPI00309B1EC2
MQKAIFFGAIGTLVETSDLQRRAFNQSFIEMGLDWYWDTATYADLLTRSGGARRVADFAANLGEQVDADTVHARKVAIFDEMLRREGLRLREGVRDVIDTVHNRGLALGFVSSTSEEQIEAIFAALGNELDSAAFNFIADKSMVSRVKPDPEIYEIALDQLGIAKDEVIAIEDSPESAEAALRAGLMTYVTPGALHVRHDFPAEAVILSTLSTDILEQQRIAAE